MKWSEKYRINTHDTDFNRVVSASGIMRYMQDASNYQMEGESPSYNELFDSGLAFVLSRLRLSIYAPLYSHDEITAETWACESHGVSFNRCYRILKGDSIAAEAVTVWGLLDTNTHRLRRVDSVELGYSMDEMLELDSPARLRIPQDANMVLVGEHRVGYGEVDINRHLNNTHYPDMYCDFIPDMGGNRVTSMGLSFLSEAPLGEQLKIYMASYDGTYYMRSVKEDGSINAEAEIILEEI